MKSRASLLPLLFAFVFALIAPRARAQEEANFDYFYDNLKPYGEWVQVADYGLCWHPGEVDDDWAPYTDGYWSFTDAGWTWVSYEDFGDIVYHYGRWVRVDGEGWCWVPDNDWGPAWVSWRNNDEYVGWAPLPPEAHFRPEVGLSVWVDETYDIGPGYYRFCRVRDFGAPVIREVCFPRERNVVFFGDTVNITNITINTGYGIPFCGGPRFDFISTRVLRPIPTLKLVRETNITNINININNRGGNRHGAFASVQRGNTLVLPAPRLRPITNRVAPLPNIVPTKVLAAEHVQRGWGDMKNAQERDHLREAVKQQNRGATPENTHARAFTQADIKAVPQKAEPNIPPVAGTAKNRPTGIAPVIGAKGGNATGVPPGETVGREPVTVPGKGKGSSAPIVTGNDQPRGNRLEEPRSIPNEPVRTGPGKGTGEPSHNGGNDASPTSGANRGGINQPGAPARSGAKNNEPDAGQLRKKEDAGRAEAAAEQRQREDAARAQDAAQAKAAARTQAAALQQQQQRIEMQREQAQREQSAARQPERSGSGFKQPDRAPATKQRQADLDGGENAARQQQQQAAAAAAARDRANDAARERANDAARQQSIARQQAAAASAARERSAQNDIPRQTQPQRLQQPIAPRGQVPPASVPSSNVDKGKGKGKDKDDDKR